MANRKFIVARRGFGARINTTTGALDTAGVQLKWVPDAGDTGDWRVALVNYNLSDAPTTPFVTMKNIFDNATGTPADLTAIILGDVAITGRSVDSDGFLTASNTIFNAAGVSTTIGPAIAAVIYWSPSGAAAAWNGTTGNANSCPLFIEIDTATNLTGGLTPNGTDNITINWSNGTGRIVTL